MKKEEELTALEQNKSRSPKPQGGGSVVRLCIPIKGATELG